MASSAQQSIPNPDHTQRFDLPAGMAQKKGPEVLTTMPGPRRNRSKHSSPPREQESETKKGVSDLRHRMKKARSIRRISELDDLASHLRHGHVQHEKRQLSSAGASPNYMKPTTSSYTRKERLQVSFKTHTTCGNKRSPSIPTRSKVSSSSSSSSSASSTTFASSSPSCDDETITRKRVRPLMRKILVGPLFPKVNASRATCSSTIKESKFPKGLELAPGATESQGTSAMRVCPHTYCSLNDHHGHGHDPLPPLKTFLSSRRRLLKTQKNMRLKSFRRRVSGKGDKPITVPSLKDEIDDDFSVEIYAKPSENNVELVLDQSDDICPANDDDDDDGGPGRITSVSESGKSAEIRVSNRTGDECYSELSFEENPEVESAEIVENANLNSNDFDGHAFMGSEENSFDLPGPNSPEVKLAQMNEEDENGNNGLEPEEISFGETAKTTDLETECIRGMHGDDDEATQVKSESKEQQAVRHMATEKEEDVECHVLHGDTETKKESTEPDGAACMMPQSVCRGNEAKAEGSDETPTCDQLDDCSEKGKSEMDQLDEDDTSSTKNTKFTYTRKTADDHGEEELGPFNPRAPNFLPVQPDPEEERVDLRHQVTDDRKNAEEWMVDCALQRVVGRLAPARKRKVELLVEAFETVVAPVPVCEPQRNDHESPVFAARTGPIHACS